MSGIPKASGPSSSTTTQRQSPMPCPSWTDDGVKDVATTGSSAESTRRAARPVSIGRPSREDAEQSSRPQRRERQRRFHQGDGQREVERQSRDDLAALEQPVVALEPRLEPRDRREGQRGTRVPEGQGVVVERDAHLADRLEREEEADEQQEQPGLRERRLARAAAPQAQGEVQARGDGDVAADREYPQPGSGWVREADRHSAGYLRRRARRSRNSGTRDQRSRASGSVTSRSASMANPASSSARA